MTTLMIFLFKRDWLLNKKKSKIILGFNIILFILGYLLQYKSIGNSKFVVAIKISLLSQLIFIGMVYLFRKIYTRDPVDTFWTMDQTLMKDGVFNFLYWVLAFLLPAYLVSAKII